MNSAPLNIGIVANTFTPIAGGVETYLDHLSAALAAEGHSVRVVTRFVDERPTPLSALFRAAESPHIFKHGDVSVHVVAPTPVRQALLTPTYRMHHHALTERLSIELYVYAFYNAIATALDGCDVVHFSGTGREMLGFPAARVADDMNIPFVVTSHMHVGSWGDGDFDFRLYQQADAVVALTEFERAIYREGCIDDDRIFVQGHGVNVSGTGDGPRFRREAGIGNAPMILYLGRKSHYKGYPRLLEAAPAIWKNHPDARLVFAGPSDPSLNLSDEARLILDDPRVQEYGFVSDAMREDLYAACDLFCLPSEAEAFGLVYLEAGFYGTPVVALDIPTLQELIDRNDTGLLTAPTSAAVASAVSSLLSNPALRTRLGTNGRQIAAQRQWSDVARRMATLYRTRASAYSA